jgi:hypothetical protein
MRATSEDLVELRRRVQATRWPEKETVADPGRVPCGRSLATCGDG